MSNRTRLGIITLLLLLGAYFMISCEGLPGSCVDGDDDGDFICNGEDLCPLDRFNDTDSDGRCGDVDNCPTVANPGQADSDGDGDGDACDSCEYDPDNDVDGDGSCGDVDNCPEDANPGQTDGDGDLIGDVCDGCPEDEDNNCLMIWQGEHLNIPSGSVKYIGAHPLHPTTNYCCSDPTPPAESPKCLAGTDVPDIPCVVEYTFYPNGSVNKKWNPDPQYITPGITDLDGWWDYDGSTLTISTEGPIMLGLLTMTTVETYDVAYTYRNGRFLDLHGAEINAWDGSTTDGSYERHASVVVTLAGFYNATFDSQVDTIMSVSSGSWNSSMVTQANCDGPDDVCNMMVPGGTISDSGSFSTPGELIEFDGRYVLQVDDTMVFERE